MAKLRAFVYLDVDFSKDGCLARRRLGDRRIEPEMLIGIGQIACGGSKEADATRRRLGTNEEDDVFLAQTLSIAGAQTQSVSSATQITWYFEGFRYFPVAVDQGVGVKFNSAVFVRRQPEAIVATAPVPAGLRANRPVISLGMQVKGPDVGDDITDSLIGVAIGRIPIGNQSIRRRR